MAQKINKTEDLKAKALTHKDFGFEQSGKRIAPQGISIYVRKLLQNWRQGTVGVKGRSEVSFSNKKPWKQKGTGRARAGSARSPLWRGGGVIFGPQPRVRTLSISKKLRKGVLGTIALDYIENKKIFSLPWNFTGNAPKTSYAYNLLKQTNLAHEKSIVFVSADDVLAYSSFMNIPNVQVLLFDEVNAFDLMNGRNWIILQKDLPIFKEMVSKWL